MNQTIEKPAKSKATPKRTRRIFKWLIAPVLLGLIIAGQYFHNWTNDQLLDAVVEGNNDRVSFMLSLRADPNSRLASLGVRVPSTTLWDRFLALFGGRRTVVRIDRFRTALMLAAGSNHPDIVINLINHGADPNIKLYNGATALSYCGAKADPKVAIALINHGADVNIRTSDGITPLQQACTGGKVEVIKALLEHGANVHEKGTAGETPLMLAAMSHGDEAVSFLLQHGATLADIHAPPVQQPQPFGAGVTRVTVNGVTRIATSGVITGGSGGMMGDSYGPNAMALMAATSPLNFAAHTGSKSLLQLAWDSAPESERKGPPGMHALVTAINTGHPEFAFDMLRRGVRFKPERPGDPDPLYSAVSMGNKELVEWLLAHGVPVADPASGRRPAIIAAATNYAANQTSNAMASKTPAKVEMVDLLLRHGADINAADPNSGETAIFDAARNPQVLAALLSRGARIDVKDRTGRTPLLATYEARGARLLLDRGADPNSQDSSGVTLLLRAAEQRNLELIKLLVSRGANPNLVDRFGNSPLRMAQQTAWAEGIAALKKAGAKDLGPIRPPQQPGVRFIGGGLSAGSGIRR